jgi:hypothetical protein
VCYLNIRVSLDGEFLYVDAYLWPCTVSYSTFCAATFCGAPSYVLDKYGRAAGGLRNAALCLTAPLTIGQ